MVRFLIHFLVRVNICFFLIIIKCTLGLPIYVCGGLLGGVCDFNGRGVSILGHKIVLYHLTRLTVVL